MKHEVCKDGEIDLHIWQCTENGKMMPLILINNGQSLT